MKRQKTCSCCGGDAGKFEQWPNQDKGWGICRSCVDWILGRGTSPEEMHQTHGVAGIHYEPKMFRLYGREYIILAEFPNNEQGMRDGNAYMLAHDGACLLDAQGPKLILADRDDKGVPVRAQEVA